MLSASGALLIEGAIRGVWRTAAGAAVGAVFIWGIHRALGGHELHLGELRGADALKGILIVGVMTLHSFAEGVGIGVSYGGGAELGSSSRSQSRSTTFPRVSRSAPCSSRAGPASLGGRLEHLLEPAAAARGGLAFLFVEQFRPSLAAGLGFAGGAMIWLVFAELLPDAREELETSGRVVWLGGSLLVMSLLQFALLGH